MNDAPSIHAMAQRKARYGHRDWIVWTDKDGTRRAEPKSPASVKAALLANGTQGRNWTLYCGSTGVPMRGSWWLGLIAIANMRVGVY